MYKVLKYSEYAIWRYLHSPIYDLYHGNCTDYSCMLSMRSKRDTLISRWHSILTFPVKRTSAKIPDVSSGCPHQRGDPLPAVGITMAPLLQWRHNERYGVSNHQPHVCLLNRLFKVPIKENIKVRGLPRWPVNSPHKWPSTRKMFPFDYVIMVRWFLHNRNVWYHEIIYCICSYPFHSWQVLLQRAAVTPVIYIYVYIYIHIYMGYRNRN